MRTPITYYGGKQTMLADILPLIPEHRIYTEPFCGGAAVFFAKRPAEVEIINDLDSELVNFYHCLKHNFDALKDAIDATLHSREVHTHAMYIYNHPVWFSEIERAWAVWTLSKLSFASMLDGAFGYDFKGMMIKKIRNGKHVVRDSLCYRLERTTIERRDALDVIACYDSPDAFHFVDPPYVNSDCGHYAGLFGMIQLEQLLNLLVDVKGKFMLTMFPLDLIESYASKNGWKIHRIQRTISASKVSRRNQEEWIIMNYANVRGGIYFLPVDSCKTPKNKRIHPLCV